MNWKAIGGVTCLLIASTGNTTLIMLLMLTYMIAGIVTAIWKINHPHY